MIDKRYLELESRVKHEAEAAVAAQKTSEVGAAAGAAAQAAAGSEAQAAAAAGAVPCPRKSIRTILALFVFNSSNSNRILSSRELIILSDSNFCCV